jgi:hypothetical protein
VSNVAAADAVVVAVAPAAAVASYYKYIGRIRNN